MPRHGRVFASGVGGDLGYRGPVSWRGPKTASLGLPEAPVQAEELASWELSPATGEVSYSGQLLRWLGEPGDAGSRAGMELLERAVHPQDRALLAETIENRRPGYRSIGHRLRADGKECIVQHHIGYDPERDLVVGILLDGTPRARMSEALAMLAGMVSSADEVMFVRRCIEQLAVLFRTRFGFVAVVSEDGLRARTVAVWTGEGFEENFEYELRGTPCADVMSLQKALIPCDAVRLYPDDDMLADMGVESYFGAPLFDARGRVFGIVSVMDSAALEVSTWTAPVLGVFASRVGVELLRAREERTVRAKEVTLMAERAKTEKFEALARLGSSVAHDFNNLLMVMMGNAELLVDPDLPHAERAGRVEELQAAGEQAGRLIRRLLDFGRREEEAPARLDFGESLRGLEPVLQRLMGSKGALHLDVAQRPVGVALEAGAAEQIALNLVVNARDAIRDGGRVDLGLHAEEGYAVLEVRDDGHGMSKDTCERVFEPYFSTKPRGEGSGLGLATVFGIVRAAGGTIDVDSDPGEGTTFRVQLPLIDDAPS